MTAVSTEEKQTFAAVAVYIYSTDKEIKRLRSVGVAFLKFSVSNNLFQTFPHLNEGELTQTYAVVFPKIRDRVKFHSRGGRNSTYTFIGDHLIQFGAYATYSFFNFPIVLTQGNVANLGKTPPSTVNEIYQQKGFQKLEDKIGYVFHDRSLLLRAFTNGCHELSNSNGSYQRLEFLGDAVLEYLTVRYLYDHTSEFDCGKIALYRGYLASNGTLARLAQKLGLSEYMICNARPMMSQKGCADILESLVGAVLNDCGGNLDIVWNVVYKMLKIMKRNRPSKKKRLALKKRAIAKTVVDTAASKEITRKKRFTKRVRSVYTVSKSVRYVGGAFLQYCVRTVVFQSFPDYHEGQLTRKSEEELPKLHNILEYYLKGSHLKVFVGSFLILNGVRLASMFLKNFVSVKEKSIYCQNVESTTIKEIYHQKGFQKLEEKIGYIFRDRSLLLRAFTHISHELATRNGTYQRLEFLGDAVLGYLIGRHIFNHNPKLIPLCEKLRSNSTFACLTKMHGFENYLLRNIRKSIGRHNYADIFESIAGAIYIDSGMNLDVVWNVFYKLMKEMGCFNELELNVQACVTQ